MFSPLHCVAGDVLRGGPVDYQMTVAWLGRHAVHLWGVVVDYGYRYVGDRNAIVVGVGARGCVGQRDGVVSRAGILRANVMATTSPVSVLVWPARFLAGWCWHGGPIAEGVQLSCPFC